MKLTWHAITQGPLTLTDWKQVLASGASVDPYLVWADFTELSGVTHRKTDPWPVLVQFEKGADPALPAIPGETACKPSAECHPVLGMLAIPGIYKFGINGALQRRSDYVTALVSPSCIPELYRCPELIKRFQLGLPRIPEVAVAPRDESPPKPPLVDTERARVVVGVIDDGFAWAHTQFREQDGHRSRTAFLWDQFGAGDDARKRPWLNFGPGLDLGANGPRHEQDNEFGYGAELQGEDLKGDYGLEQPGGEANASHLKPLKVYEKLDYAPRRPDPDDQSLRLSGVTPYGGHAPLDTIKNSSHGTSVAALAAGSRLTLPKMHSVQGQWPVQAADKDSSNNWPLVLVQLPARTSLDSSGGSLGVHILDGLRYIVRRARQLPYTKDDTVLMSEAPSIGALSFSDAAQCKPPPATELGQTKSINIYPKNKVVVNISYGAVAGPHDGTSLIEEAIADMVKCDRGLWVVLAAGNAHGSKTHSRIELQESGDSKRLTWTVGPDNLLESYLEIWFPDCDSLGNELDAAWLQQVTVDVRPPAGLPELRAVRHGSGHILTAGATDLPVAAALYSRKVAQGTRGTMLLLTCARTRRPFDQTVAASGKKLPVAPHGRWEIEMRWGPGRQATGRKMVVHAWAERNDQLWGHGRRQQSTVVGDDPVPDKTDFSPSVREFEARGRMRLHTGDVPRPYQAELSGGSLAHVPGSTHKALPHFGTDAVCIGAKPGAVVVGSRRLSDDEMARYSGAGVSRSAPMDRGRIPGGDGAGAPENGEGPMDTVYAARVRNGGPDVDAPGDMGVALRGLRTTGFREGSVTRLGGTSAAAPLVTRYIADHLYRLAIGLKCEESKPRELEELPPEAKQQQAENRARRGTGTPTRDDRVHRGRKSLGPRKG